MLLDPLPLFGGSWHHSDSSSPPPGSQLFRSLKLVLLPRAICMLKAPGKDSSLIVCRSNTSVSSQPGAQVREGKMDASFLGLFNLSLLGSLAKGATRLWHQILLWRSKPGSSARSLNNCLVDRTSVLASSTTTNTSGSASSGAHMSHSRQVSRSPVCSGPP